MKVNVTGFDVSVLKADKSFFKKEMHGRLFSFPESGITVAVWPSCGGINPRFYNAAVAFCSEMDVFKKKTGQREVLDKVFSGGGMLFRANGLPMDEFASWVEGYVDLPGH